MASVSNTEKGKQFQRLALDALSRLTGLQLEAETEVRIGNKPHRFDLASKDQKYVAECKAFTWTAGGNVPSAKISTLREAVNYLGQLPEGTRRLLVLKQSLRAGYSESLAEYFARLNDELLGDVCVIELSDDGSARIIRGRLS